MKGQKSEQKNLNPILIPENSVLEGFIKTEKALRIESNFFGTLLSLEKVIIDKSSKVVGDIVCAELMISGYFEGNIFCTGKVIVNGGSKIKGQVFTKYFQNNDDCDLSCLIHIPNNQVLDGVNEILKNINANTKLSTDNSLQKIVQSFKENIFKEENLQPGDIAEEEPVNGKKEEDNPKSGIPKKILANQFLNTL